MTPEELIARTRELDAEATKGPWTDDGTGHLWHEYPQGYDSQWEGEHVTLGRFDRNDFDLIAFYRTAAPALADALEAEREKVKVAREALEQMVEYPDVRQHVGSIIHDKAKKALTQLDQ